MKLLFLLIFLIPGLQEEKYDIRLKLEEGQTYYHTIRTETDFLMMVNEEEMLISTIFEASLIYEVTVVHDTFYNFQVQYEKLLMVNKAPMITFKISSDTTDSTNMMSGFFKEMVHKPFTLSMNKNGKITELLNIDTLYSTIWDGKAGEMISSNGKMTEQLKDQMGAAMIMENYELLSAFYPGKHVEVGESWSNSTTLGNRLAGTTINIFTLTDVSDEGIIIHGESETYTKNKDANMEIMGKTMEYNMDGNMIFSCTMDYRTGWIQEATIRQNFKGDITMVAKEGWNNRSIPIAVTSVIEITSSLL